MFANLQSSDFFLSLEDIGMVTCLLFLCSVVYLKIRWLAKVEKSLDEPASYSSNFFLAGTGVLHYGTVFMWDYQAKRYNLLEKRNAVPKCIQRQFMVPVFLSLLILPNVLIYYLIT